jgi:hypothetical protein
VEFLTRNVSFKENLNTMHEETHGAAELGRASTTNCGLGSP